MVSLRFSFIAALVTLSIATPTDRSALLVHEHRAQPARGFVSTGPAPSDAELTLRIALNPNNIAGLESELYAVSDPSSSRYGQYLTPEDVAEYVKPTSDALSAVTSWLQKNKISATTISPAGDFSVFTHSTTDETTIRTLQYSLPVELSAAVAYIHPTTTFSRPFAAPKSQPLPSNSKRDIDPTCADITTISCLQVEYGIPTTSATQTNNVLGVSAYDNEFANFNDLKQFLAEYRPDLPATTKFDVELLDGGSNTQITGFAGVEASLDIDYTVGAASGVPVKFISVGPLNNDTVSGFLDQINALISDPSRPTVLTTSYGADEEDMTLPVAQGLCNAYAQLGALGTSILFASGDGGVAGNEFECTTFVPTAPSTCTSVTSIGSSQRFWKTLPRTTFPKSARHFLREVCFLSLFLLHCDLSALVGFSNYFEAPAYQKGDVDAYISSLGDTYSGLFNTTGRGFPDVSAEGVNFVVVSDCRGFRRSAPSV
ncbi:family S53 protease [Mycena albidolilacea]|uniref:Family S53 protease n=1 Tax=Mycena albidolilacea TaxID=1033008 RepID=A0AAD6Z790_9AGAR|nr:family S53 protease [Mycena albidolilacea]